MFLRLPVALLVACVVLQMVAAEEASPPKTVGLPISAGIKTPKEPLGEYVVFPASGVKVRQPENFEQQTSFEGFGQENTQASLLIMSVAHPYSELSAGFTKEQMKARGWTLLSKEELNIEKLPGVLVYFQQPAGSKVFLKWSLIFGGDDKTLMITATLPKDRERELSSQLKAAVLSARLEGQGDPEANLPFTLTASTKLKAARIVSNISIFTKDGVVPAKSPEDPLFIAAPSLAKAATGDKKQFAEQRLRSTAHTKDLTVKAHKAIKIAGLEGFESVAEARDPKSNTPLTVYQVMLFNDDSYILVQGLVGTKVRDDYLPEFKAMARSLKMKAG